MASASAPGRQAPLLADYLEKLPGTTFRRLYQSPSAAFAIFRRMLPPLAKTFVLRMLYYPGALPLGDLDLWVKPDAKRNKDQCVAVLRSLHIITISPFGRDRPPEVNLSSNFRSSLRQAIEGGGVQASFGTPSALPVPPEVDVAFLDRYARRKREDILHYIVNSVDPAGGIRNESSSGPKNTVRELLLAGRLVERRPDVRGVAITQSGFTFLLQESNAQVWTLLLLWIEAMGRDGPGGLDQVDMLTFQFMLATAELGRAYDTDSLTEDRKNMLPFLVDFGLIYVPPHKPQQYFPTRLATTLTSVTSSLRTVSAGMNAAISSGTAPPPPPSSSSSPSSPSSSAAAAAALSGRPAKGSIVIETNFRIYAHTSSPLQIAVISLFSQLKMRFPDMVTGRLSRGSIRRAISFGITSDQVINYLAVHAHDHMRRNAIANSRAILPPTVVDQIRLWQLENERMKTTSGFLFKDFDSAKEFQAVARFADEIGVLVWRSDAAGMFFASKHEQIRDFLKLRKKAD